MLHCNAMAKSLFRDSRFAVRLEHLSPYNVRLGHCTLYNQLWTHRQLTTAAIKSIDTIIPIKQPITVNTNEYKQYNYHKLANNIIIGTSVLSFVLWFVTDIYTFDGHKTRQQSNQQAYNELLKLLGDRLSTDTDDILLYGKAQHSYHSQTYPSAICTVESSNEVSSIVKICNKYNIAIIAYGSGTSLEGHTSADTSDTRDTIVLNLQNMNSILRVNETDLDCTVQAGLNWNALNEDLAKYNLYFPVDPGPGASIGGMSGCRCSGTNCVRHGTMANNVLNLTVVLPNGKIIKTAQRARKSAAGYNLTQLFIGSEGTLGIITEATLKLQRIPEHVAVGVVAFDNIHDAASAATHVLNNGIQIGCVELLDDQFMPVINKVNNYNYPIKPHIFFKFTGNKQNVDLDIQRTEQIIQQYTKHQFTFSKTEQEQKQLWNARKDALWSTIEYYRPKQSLITDVCVPVSKIADVITDSVADIKQSWLPAPIVAHIGDGNFHALVMFEPGNVKDLNEAKRLSHNMVQRAIEAEGTCTGEHGVGLGKKQYLIEELGGDTVDLMRKIKHAVDPNNIMNPNKIFNFDGTVKNVDQQYETVGQQDNTTKPRQVR